MGTFIKGIIVPTLVEIPLVVKFCPPFVHYNSSPSLWVTSFDLRLVYVKLGYIAFPRKLKVELYARLALIHGIMTLIYFIASY